MSLRDHVSIEVIDGLAYDIATNYGQPLPKDRNTLKVRVDYPTGEYADIEYANIQSWILMATEFRERKRSKAMNALPRPGIYLLGSEYVRNEAGLFVDSSTEYGRPDGSRGEKVGPRRLLRAQFILENMRDHLELQ